MGNILRDFAQVSPVLLPSFVSRSSHDTAVAGSVREHAERALLVNNTGHGVSESDVPSRYRQFEYIALKPFESKQYDPRYYAEPGPE
jgi:hypothetical protein